MKYLLLILFTISVAHAQNDKVKLIFKIENSTSDTLILTKENFKRVLFAKSKGIFETSFSAGPDIYYMRTGNEVASLYLKNGYDLVASVNADKFDETLIFEGIGRTENNLLAKQNLEIKLLWNQLRKVKNDFAALSDLIQERLKSPSEPKDESIDERLKKLIADQNETLKMDLANVLKGMSLKGKESPLFAYEDIDGNIVKLENYRGKYVLIDIWATWCAPCIDELPFLENIRKKYDAKLEVIYISIDSKNHFERWRNMVRNKAMSGKQLIADNTTNSNFMKAFGVDSVPRYIIIGPEGKVIEPHASRPSDPLLTEQLDLILR